MKELSIEEKAKAYDKAIAHAKLLLKIIGNATLGNLVLKNEFKNMFPALEALKELPIWEKVSPDTGQTTLYKDGGKSYLERFGYRIDLKDLDKLPKKELKAQKGEKV